MSNQSKQCKMAKKKNGVLSTKRKKTYKHYSQTGKLSQNNPSRIKCFKSFNICILLTFLEGAKMILKENRSDFVGRYHLWTSQNEIIRLRDEHSGSFISHYKFNWPSLIAHACNPSIQGGKGKRIMSSKSTWTTLQDPISKIKTYTHIYIHTYTKLN